MNSASIVWLTPDADGHIKNMVEREDWHFGLSAVHFANACLLLRARGPYVFPRGMSHNREGELLTLNGTIGAWNTFFATNEDKEGVKEAQALLARNLPYVAQQYKWKEEPCPKS
tara:strand:+ start:782 stop:1123 length:342 start_codon:yes stop_codon:yes gene_type:complete